MHYDQFVANRVKRPFGKRPGGGAIGGAGSKIGSQLQLAPSVHSCAVIIRPAVADPGGARRVDTDRHQHSSIPAPFPSLWIQLLCIQKPGIPPVKHIRETDRLSAVLTLESSAMNNNQTLQRQSMATSGNAVKQRQLVCVEYLFSVFFSLLPGYLLKGHLPNTRRPGTVAFPASSTLRQPLGYGESPPHDQRPSGVYAWIGQLAWRYVSDFVPRCILPSCTIRRG